MPPIDGPIALAVAKPMLLTACHLPRSRAENRSPMTMNDSVPMLPAPTPWTVRNTTSSTMLLASPLSSEPTRNSPTATMNTPRRPYRSASLPATATVAVADRK